MPSARRQLAHRHGLALAVGEGPGGAPGVAAVDDLRARAERAVEAQHVGEHLGHLLRGGRADVDRAPGVLVGVGDLEHLRVQARQHAGQHLGRQALQVDHALAGDHLADLAAHAVGRLVGRAAQAELHVLPAVARDPPAGEQARAARGARPVQARRAGHQRAVEVEERGAPPVLGAGRARLLLRGDVVRHAPLRVDLQDHRVALAAAAADGGAAQAAAAPAQLVHERAEDARARGADRVARGRPRRR